MKRASLSFVALGAVALVAQACQGDFPTIGAGKRLVVTITQGEPGFPSQRLPILVAQPTTFTVDVEAQLPDGTLDTSFNGYVNILSQPGTVSDSSTSGTCSSRTG